MEFIEKIFSLPKTIYINCKCFGITDALKMRVRVHYGVRCKNIRKGCIEFQNQTGVLNVGFSTGSFQMGKNHKGALIFGDKGKLVLKGNAYLPAGSIVNCQGTIILGREFESNARLTISCENKISIGDNPAIGWDVTICDADGHDIIDTSYGVVINSPKEIIIGNHVWLCAKCTVLKGTTISDHSVVGFGTIVSGSYTETNVLIAGMPAKVKKKGIDWNR